MIPMRSIVIASLFCRAGRTALVGASMAMLAEALVHSVS